MISATFGPHMAHYRCCSWGIDAWGTKPENGEKAKASFSRERGFSLQKTLEIHNKGEIWYAATMAGAPMPKLTLEASEWKIQDCAPPSVELTLDGLHMNSKYDFARGTNESQHPWISRCECWSHHMWPDQDIPGDSNAFQRVVFREQWWRGRAVQWTGSDHLGKRMAQHAVQRVPRILGNSPIETAAGRCHSFIMFHHFPSPKMGWRDDHPQPPKPLKSFRFQSPGSIQWTSERWHRRPRGWLRDRWCVGLWALLLMLLWWMFVCGNWLKNMVNWWQPGASFLELMPASCISDIKVALGLPDDKNRGYALGQKIRLEYRSTGNFRYWTIQFWVSHSWPVPNCSSDVFFSPRADFQILHWLSSLILALWVSGIWTTLRPLPNSCSMVRRRCTLQQHQDLAKM